MVRGLTRRPGTGGGRSASCGCARELSQVARACLCVHACARARREGGMHTAPTGKAQPSWPPLHLSLPQTRTRGGLWARERATVPSRARRRAREVGLGEERGGREEGRRRIREVLQLFDRSRGSGKGREDRSVPVGQLVESGPPGAVGRGPRDAAPPARSAALAHPAPPPPCQRAGRGRCSERRPRPPGPRAPVVPVRVTMLLPQLCWLPLLAGLLPPARAQKFSALTFLRVDQDKDKDCSLDCGGSPQKPVCASDGRTFLSRCEFQRAKCKDPQLEIAYRGNCKDVSRCVAERKYTQEQARKEFQQVFIPECKDDGTYSQVQCHSYTGYCWCVTPNGRPISGTAVAHKTPRCPGSVNEKLPQREGTGKTDDASAPALETQPQGDEEDIASRYPTLWTEQVKSRQNKTNKNSVSSCDQEQQSALEEARQPKNDNVVIPECAHGGLYKPVQCHPSTGYCWCVLVDTGRPIPGTSTRYEQPKCDNTARAHPTKTRDLYKGRQLQGCPGAKKNEFLTSILDALSTDMVHAVSDPSSSGRLSEPDPSHTLEERVVHWYFKLLDKNSSGDIGKKEIKPFKRFLRKKSKPKKCVKKFVEYCDVNNDKSISVQELMGCLGVTKEEAPRGNPESTSNRQVSMSLV
uniref:SPARC related modular calcium binding 2 n=1 Tax=Equus asinus asinus TaxID=83772 RepID=A0A8C4KQA5_EQUAS